VGAEGAAEPPIPQPRCIVLRLRQSEAEPAAPQPLVMPSRLALLLQIAQLSPLAVVVHVALPSYPVIDWRGLFTDPDQTASGVAVSFAWAAVATALAYRVFMRRKS
jgi:ABC-2 type transport system permease protein